MWEIPSFDNADTFVDQMQRQGLLVHDPVVRSMLQGESQTLSSRALQYRFLRATGISHKLIQQIERAHRAAALLEQSKSASDIVFDLGYFDQAHLTNSLKRFLGQTPASMVRSRQAR